MLRCWLGSFFDTSENGSIPRRVQRASRARLPTASSFFQAGIPNPTTAVSRRFKALSRVTSL